MVPARCGGLRGERRAPNGVVDISGGSEDEHVVARDQGSVDGVSCSPEVHHRAINKAHLVGLDDVVVRFGEAVPLDGQLHGSSRSLLASVVGDYLPGHHSLNLLYDSASYSRY